jgi:steroid 5-alpha reductase family enzyme
VVTLLVTLWGLRLSLHVYLRNKDKPEDERYRKWREEWGKYVYIRSYFQAYLLQGALLFLIVLPVLIINMNPGGTWHIFSTLGVIVWIGGFFVEVVGDWQLAQFLKDPENKGELMTHGLWRYTRHPNYFGEVTLWWGIWIMALSVPYGWATVIGPITITVLILKVSGVPMLEEKMADHPDFAEYKKKTSMFIPWFRKSD